MPSCTGRRASRPSPASGWPAGSPPPPAGAAWSTSAPADWSASPATAASSSAHPLTPRISAERLLGDLAELAKIGGRPDGGVDRVAGSEADLEARRWLASRIRAAGLEPRTDQAGNVFGRVPGSRGPWLLLGSHTDTVPAGGRLDGAYGVIAGLEVLRAFHEAGHPSAEQLEIVSFYD